MTTSAAVTRVLYVQYTNPAAYPPIEHSAHLLADAGCEVLVLGTDILGDAMTCLPHPRIHVRLRPSHGAGFRQKVHYASFLTWCTLIGLRWRPDWVYASDPLAAPLALALGLVTNARVVYHEHDSPAPANGGTSGFMRLVLAARARVARTAAVCVLPNARRAVSFAEATGRRDPVTVWNCPLRREVSTRPPRVDGELRVFYHGSIVPARLPVAAVEALALVPAVSLTVAGYETQGHPGYVAELRRAAATAGVADRVRFLGTLTRLDSMSACATCDVGLSLVPTRTDDVNEDAMVGASNKTFDYLACGLAVLVCDREDWRRAFVDPGFGLACDPASAGSIAAALRQWAAAPAELAAMGERGRRQILDAWNYEAVFRPVSLQILSAPQPTVAPAQLQRDGRNAR